MKRIGLFSLLICTIVILFSLFSPDIFVWRTIDAGSAPLRTFFGDQSYYVLRVREAILSGRPIGSSYFAEHRLDPSRFMLFEALVAETGKIAAPFVGTNPAVLSWLLRLFSFIGVVLIMTFTVRRWAGFPLLDAGIFSILSAAFILPTGLFQGPALNSWFIPFALTGIVLAVSGVASSHLTQRVAYLLLSTLLFGLHPVSLTFGLSFILMILLWQYSRERDTRTLWAGLIWLCYGLALFLLLYGNLLFGILADHADLAVVMARNASTNSRFPVAPISSLRLLLILIPMLICMRRAPLTQRVRWGALIALVVTTVLGANANLITGRFLLNDHYLFLQPFIFALAASLSTQIPVLKPTRFEFVGLCAVAAVFLEYGVRNAKNYGVLANPRILAPLAIVFFAALLIAAAFGKPARLLAVPHAAKYLAMIAISVFPAFSIMYYGFATIPEATALQSRRALLEGLDALPSGVVLTNTSLSGLTPLYTKHLPYWSQEAFGDDIAQSELFRRWQDAMVLFPSDSGLIDATARTALFGSDRLNCGNGSRKERLFLAVIKRLGAEKTLCAMIANDFEWQTLKERAVNAARTEREGWKPSYRLDWLIIDRSRHETVPPALQSHFFLERTVAEFSIYRFVQNPKS